MKIEVEDNGPGIGSIVPNRAGMGLANMRARRHERVGLGLRPSSRPYASLAG
jgi:hypothetical protein